MKQSRYRVQVGERVLIWDRQNKFSDHDYPPAAVGLATYRSVHDSVRFRTITVPESGRVGDVQFEVIEPVFRRKIIAPTPASLHNAPANADITLLPGYHEIRTPIRLKPGQRIYAHGATIHVRTNGQRSCGFIPAPGCEIHGGTWIIEDMLLYGDDPADHMRLHGCEFRNGAIGQWTNQEGLEVYDCRFINAAASMLRGGHIARCQFIGVCIGERTVLVRRCGTDMLGLAITDCTFLDTGGGIAMEGVEELNEPLFSGLTFTSVAGTGNGGELLSVDKGDHPLRDAQVRSWLTTACRGPINAHGRGIINAEFFNCHLDVQLDLSHPECRDNDIVHCEWSRSGPIIAEGQTGTRIANCVIPKGRKLSFHHLTDTTTYGGPVFGGALLDRVRTPEGEVIAA